MIRDSCRAVNFLSNSAEVSEFTMLRSQEFRTEFDGYAVFPTCLTMLSSQLIELIFYGIEEKCKCLHIN